MIPSDDLMSTTNEQFNIYRSNNSDSRWVYCADEHEHENQVDTNPHFNTSRTDKPRLAHEIYGQWMAILPLRNDQISGNRTLHAMPLNRNDLLVAAYSGSNIMYRK